MPRALLLLSACVALAFAGCRRGDSTPAAAGDGSVARSAGTAALDASLCSEHGVLESICTKCHPKLVPIFQAKGDWCAKHGFPESVCPIDHPERGGKPAVDVSAEEPPADGTRIRFKTQEAAREAGLETVRVVAGGEPRTISAIVTVTADAARMAAVNPRAAGVVRALHADLGTRVRPGTPLALIESAAVGADRSRLRAAEARAEVATAAYRREHDLFEKGISSSKEVDVARQESEAAQAEAATARAALSMVGAQSGTTSGLYTLRAPIAGVVTRRSAMVGSLVDTDHTLFEIVNTSSVWADIDVPEAEAGHVTLGQRVTIDIDGLPGRSFAGRVSYVAPLIDPSTRTMRARAALANPGGVLRANMSGRASIAAEVTDHAVVVPRVAVQEARGARIVFVRLSDRDFETRRVNVQFARGDEVQIAGGLQAGEQVVTAGSFLLKTETLKDALGTGCCEVEPPKN